MSTTKQQPRLFTYCIPGDDGAAPNPYWGICTLNICKPVIRRLANVGDWVAGTGSKLYGMEGKVVYAMKVTQKMLMQDYENHCKSHLNGKIPDLSNLDHRSRVGDCIYDFSTNPAVVRPSVHDVRNRDVDLGGKFTLLSEHFYYFGSAARMLPDCLLPIVKQGQGHKSTMNQAHVDSFISWITEQSDAFNNVLADPYLKQQLLSEPSYLSSCAARDNDCGERDEELWSGCEAKE